MTEGPMARQTLAGLSLSQLNFHNNNNNDSREAPPSQTSSCTDSVLLQDGGEDLQWCADYPFNREFQRQPSSVSSSKLLRQSILMVAGGSLEDLAYEDLSKNIDANLAEIDMETFRSEDMHALLALPALYGGTDFQSASHGDRCASVSGSFLETLPLEASATGVKVGSATDDSGEMSICRDEPLFSPVKEVAPPVTSGVLSTDSLDCSSYEEHDFVLTCQANKDNYTIAFEASGTRFSDESSDCPEQQQQPAPPSAMARSELSFTTWHRLRDVTTSKSQSLPNLLRRSTTGRVGDACLPLYTLQSSRDEDVDARSLLRLFMRSKAASGGSLSSSRSEDSASAECESASMESKSSSSGDSRLCGLEFHKEDVVHRQNNLLGGNDKGTNASLPRTPINTVKRLEANNNNGVDARTGLVNDNDALRRLSESEEDTSSQYFEDSLVEAAQPRPKAPGARSPIREEEEPLESSGDETMRDSRDLMSSEGGASSEDSAPIVARNNDVNSPLRRIRQCGQPLVGTDRIQNVFPTTKSTNVAPVEDAGHTNQGTQTKRLNNRDGAATSLDEASSNQRSSLPDRTSLRESGTMSSGYVSRQNSVDQIHRQTALLSAGGNRRKPTAVIARTRHSSTQVPVHIRDRSIQTSVEGAVATEGSNWLYTVDDSSASMQRSFNVTMYPQSTKEPKQDGATPTRSIYVCYPNYSLPDLSFLNELASAEDKPDVVLKPTQHRLPRRDEERDEDVPHRRAQSSDSRASRRPKSCTDFEDLSRRNLSHIQDWDSLSVLLPDDVKALVSRYRHAAKKDAPGDVTTTTTRSPVLRPLNLDQAGNVREEVGTFLAMSPPKGFLGQRGILRRAAEEGDGGWCRDPVFPEEVPNRRHSLQDYRRLFKNLPDLDGLLPPCGDLTSSTGLGKEPHPLSRTNSEGSWRRGGHTRNKAQGLSAVVTQQQHPCCACRAKKAVSFSEDLNVESEEQKASRASAVCTCNCRSSPVKTYGSAERLPRNMTLPFFKGDEEQRPPREFSVSTQCLSPSTSPSCFASPLSRSQKELVDQKKGLLDSALRCTKQVIDSCTAEHNSQQPIINSLSEDSTCGRLTTEYLLPAMEALLSDGLQPHVRGLFGPLPNSLWHLTESLAQTKDVRKEILDLVEYIQKSDVLSDEGQKFRACMLGLLNLGCLDTWFVNLFSNPQVQQKHYQTSSAFLSLLSHPSLFFLREELTCNLHLLSELPFGFSLSFAPLSEAPSLKPHLAPRSPFPPSPRARQGKGEESDDTEDDLRKVTCHSLVGSSFEEAVTPDSKGMQICPPLPETLDNSSRVLELQRKLRAADPQFAAGLRAYPAMHGDEEEARRFKQLRNHWEKMSHAPSEAEKKGALPPSPTKVPTMSPTKATRSLPRPSSMKSPRTARSGVPTRRSQTPDSRTSSPNISSSSAVPAGRQQPQQRRSLIPVHRGWKRPGSRQGEK
uniref:Putative phosphatase 1 binding protein n=1 Tax=Ornithodoros turicata TaxID=34597 RepID=A0A2R5L997_9ACAR